MPADFAVRVLLRLQSADVGMCCRKFLTPSVARWPVCRSPGVPRAVPS